MSVFARGMWGIFKSGLVVLLLSALLPIGPALADHETGHDTVARGSILDLEQRVWNIEQTLLTLPDTSGLIAVDCGLGATIQGAVDAAADGTRIEVSGACAETVIIDKDRIDLVGLPGAAVTGYIEIKGNNVAVRNFTAIVGDNGRPAVRVRQGGTAIIDNNTLVGDSNGVSVVYAAHVHITNNQITAGTASEFGNGVGVGNSSSARISGNTISGVTWGVIAVRSSSVDVINNTISNSASGGIGVIVSSSARIGGNTITGNGRGIVIGLASAAQISPNQPTLGFDAPNTLQNDGVEVNCRGFSGFQVGMPQIFLDPPTDVSIGPDCAAQGSLS